MRCASALLVALALGALASAVGGRAASGGFRATTTIRVTATAGDARYLVDKAPEGYPNKGDVIRETSTLRNAVAQFGRPRGAVVGRDTWVTTVVTPPFARLDVRETTDLPGGTIRARGTVTVLQTTGTFQVVGGTGAYRDARGTITLKNLNSSGTRGLSVYRLRIP